MARARLLTARDRAPRKCHIRNDSNWRKRPNLPRQNQLNNLNKSKERYQMGEAYLESWMIQVILVAGLFAGLWKGYKLAVMDKEDKHGDT